MADVVLTRNLKMASTTITIPTLERGRVRLGCWLLLDAVRIGVVLLSA
jgi:hypothetical protein